MFKAESFTLCLCSVHMNPVDSAEQNINLVECLIYHETLDISESSENEELNQDCVYPNVPVSNSFSVLAEHRDDMSYAPEATLYAPEPDPPPDETFQTHNLEPKVADPPDESSRGHFDPYSFPPNLDPSWKVLMDIERKLDRSSQARTFRRAAEPPPCDD